MDLSQQVGTGCGGFWATLMPGIRGGVKFTDTPLWPFESPTKKGTCLLNPSPISCYPGILAYFSPFPFLGELGSSFPSLPIQKDFPEFGHTGKLYEKEYLGHWRANFFQTSVTRGQQNCLVLPREGFLPQRLGWASVRPCTNKESGAWWDWCWWLSAVEFGGTNKKYLFK